MIDTQTLILILGVIGIAAFSHGVLGFSFPIIATALLAMMMDLQTAIMYTLVPTIVINFISLNVNGGFCQAVKNYWKLALITMVGAAAGAMILIIADPNLFKLLLAALMLFYLYSDTLELSYAWLHKRPLFYRVCFGFCAGLFGGLTNVMTPILLIYVLEITAAKKDTVQVLNLCFMVGKIVQLVLFVVTGVITVETLALLSWPLLLVALIALFLGIGIHRRISAHIYKKILRIVLFILAIILAVESIFVLFS